MQSTRPASIRFLRISPSPDWLDRHRAVGEHEAGGTVGRQVMDDVLHPREVGVALRRDAVAPALVVREPLAAPVGDVERGIGQDEGPI